MDVDKAEKWLDMLKRKGVLQFKTDEFEVILDGGALEEELELKSSYDVEDITQVEKKLPSEEEIRKTLIQM